jgi:prepilin-type N-terminal cleavage/methylation domain-containing protein
MRSPEPISRLTSSRAQRRAQAGFSFIEILIVMGIISVLVGGVVVVIGMWSKKAPEFQTKNTLNKTMMLIQDWKNWSSSLPPGDVARIGVITGTGGKAGTPENRTNEGIEAIYQALYWPGFKTDPAWDDVELANIDDDKLKKAINKLDTTDLLEIVDGWGNPLVYFNSADYKKYSDSGQSYTSKDVDLIEMEVEARPWQKEDGTFYNPLGFQVYSMGRDGEPNTDDDVTPWTMED